MFSILGDLFSTFFRFFLVIAYVSLFYIVCSSFFFDFGSILEGFGMVLGGFGDRLFDDFLYYNQKSRFLKT